MANEQITIGEGVTEPIPITLLSIDRLTDDGTAIDLTGATLCDMRIQTADESDQLNYDTTNDPARLEFTDKPNGIITFTPLGTEFDATENWYETYFMVTDAAGSLIRFPSDGVVPIEIIKSF